MPCYYDSPSNSDQVEIERRAKERMYFECQSVLTKDQAIECEKMDLRQFPRDAAHLNESLCKICKVLTKEQMKTISAYYQQIEWPHKTLYDWHIRHCIDDDNLKKSLIESRNKERKSLIKERESV